MAFVGLQSARGYVHCSLCREPSIGRFHLPEGCQAHPSMTEQELCGQHYISVEPIVQMVTLVEREPRLLDWLDAR